MPHRRGVRSGTRRSARPAETGTPCARSIASPVSAYCSTHRQKANQPLAREKWWIHWNTRVQMREELKKIKRYIATPRVSKHRVFVWLGSEILPDAQLVVFARDDDYFFGVLQSKIHELWARRMGTQLRDAKSGFRYTSTTTFETFPLPWVPGKECWDDDSLISIADAARELVEKRDYWLNSSGVKNITNKQRTLTSLYNQNPSWLIFANEKLDNAVLNSYNIDYEADDETIIRELLGINQERGRM